MPAPVQLAGSPFQSSTWTTGTPKTAGGGVAVGVGDLIVVEAANEDSGDTFSTPTNTGSAAITWTARGVVSTASHCRAQGWTGAVTSAGTLTVSVTSASVNWGFIVWVYPAGSHGGVGNVPAGASGTGTLPSLTATWSANSAVLVVNGDWSAVSHGVTRSYTTAAGTAAERNYANVDSRYTTDAWEYPDSGAGGSLAVGMTTPTQTWSLVAIEVLAPSGAASEPTQWRSPFSPAMRLPGRGPQGLVEVRYAPETVGGQLFTLDLLATGTDAALFGPTQVGIIRTAAGANVPLLTRQARIVRVAANTATGLVTRLPSRTLTATGTATGLSVKTVGKTLLATNTAAGIVAAVKTKLLTLVATNGAVALIAKLVAKPFTGTSGAAASTTKQASKTVAATSPNLGIVAAIKTKLLTLTTSNTATALIIKQARAVRTGTGSNSAALATIATFRRTITAGGTNAASIIKRTFRTLSATQAAAAAFQGIRTKLLTLSATSSAAATVRRSVSAVRVASSPQLATVRKVVVRTLIASSSASAVVTAGRLVIRVLTAASGSAASLATVVQQAVLGFIDSLGGVLFSTDSDAASSGVEGDGGGSTTEGG